MKSVTVLGCVISYFSMNDKIMISSFARSVKNLEFYYNKYDYDDLRNVLEDDFLYFYHSAMRKLEILLETDIISAVEYIMIYEKLETYYCDYVGILRLEDFDLGECAGEE